MSELVPNHHAHYRQFAGIFGLLAGTTMILGRGRDARLVADLAGVTADDVVLDIGCGPGTAARHAAGLGASVVGIDPAAPMLRLARVISRLRRLPGRLTWLQGTAEELDVSDDSASVCWSIASVHHWQNLDRALDEVQRVLCPDGRFLAVEKRAEQGATGNASHGWTPEQAELFASMLVERRFREVSVTNHSVGSRDVVIVTGVG